MKTIGFPISHKENENRRALVPTDINNIENKSQLFIEEGYGEVLGFSNDEYRAAGVNIVNRETILKQDIICDPKIGDADYINLLDNQIIFGWLHAVQNRDITEKLIENKITAFAWENMFEGGRHCFWRNNEIAGEAAIAHAYMIHGIFPYNTRVAILGRGNVARGAVKVLNYMGADVMQYDRRTEQLFRNEIGEFDVIVNAVLWDTNRKDHIIYKEDLIKMKHDAMIIDISCDRNGGVETSVPTTIEEPTYFVERIRHYVVDHTPSLFYKSVSRSLSEVCMKYLDELIVGNYSEVLLNSLATRDGKIIDDNIIKFQNR